MAKNIDDGLMWGRMMSDRVFDQEEGRYTGKEMGCQMSGIFAVLAIAAGLAFVLETANKPVKTQYELNYREMIPQVNHDISRILK